MQVLPFPDAPLASGSLLFRPERRRWRLVVIAKLTFLLRPGRCELVSKAVPLVTKERAPTGGAEGSIAAPSDLVPFKAQPEFLVVGSGFAPSHGKPFEVAAEVAGRRKALRVVAEGARAVSITAESDGALGLGPISSQWPSRRRRLGALANLWSDDDLHVRILGDAFDRRYFQAAAEDQWLEALPADAAMVLDHLHEGVEHLETRLPGVAPVARVERPDEAPAAVSLVADTLLVDTDAKLVTVTWRGSVDLARPAEAGAVRLGLAEGSQLRWSTAPIPSEPPPRAEDMMEETGTLPLESRALESRALESRAPSKTMQLERVVTPETIGPDWLPPRPKARESQPARPGPPVAPPIVARAVPSSPPAAPPPAPRAYPDRGSVRPPNPLRDPAKPKEEAKPATPRAAAKPRDETQAIGPVEIVWQAEVASAALRAEPAFAERLPAVPKPEPRKKPKRGEVPQPPPPPDPAADAERERREVASVLRKAPARSAASLDALLSEALRGEEPRPPVVLVEGTLSLAFDDARALDLTCRLAQLSAKRHAPLAEALAMAADASEAVASSPSAARNLRGRIERLWREGNRDFEPGFVEEGARRGLLEERAYRKVRVLGERHVVAQLRAGDRSFPAYLPEAVADHLPLQTAFEVRLVARLVPRQDEAEAAPLALAVLAVGRRHSP